MSALPPLMSLLGIHALSVVNAVMRSLKLTTRFRAVHILTMKIRFDPATDSIGIRSIKIGHEFSTQMGSNLNNFGCMVAIDTLFDSSGGFLGSSHPMKT